MLCLPAIVQAEYRIIAVEVFKARDKTVKVKVHSDVKTENRNNISVKEATQVLKNAKGWGSAVGVAIVSDSVHLSSFVSIVQAVAENPWLDLELFRPRRVGMGEHILKHYKINPKPKPAKPQATRWSDGKDGVSRRLVITNPR